MEEQSFERFDRGPSVENPAAGTQLDLGKGMEAADPKHGPRVHTPAVRKCPRVDQNRLRVQR